MKTLSAILSSIAAKIVQARAWWLLLGLVAACAALYIDARRARADRDRAIATAEIICAQAQSTFSATRGHARGQACTDAVRALARFRRDTETETARILVENASARARAASADAQRAETTAAARNAANRKMEDADAHVADDRVDGNWFRALNALHGVRGD